MRRVALLLFVLLVAPVLAQGVKTPALLLWVKADDLAAVCKPGDRVSVWPDASGGGADLKAEGEGRPTFLVEQGRPLVRFAGDLRTIVLLYLACPAAVTSYVMADQMGADKDLAGAIVVLSTFYAFPAMAVVLLLTHG